MKRLLSVLLACLIVSMSLAACGSDTTSPTTTSAQSSISAAENSSSGNGEIVDGKFVKTRSITVEVFDRAVDGGTKVDNNFYTKFIQEGMLRDHNVEVKFISVPRWTEVEQINNLLAAGTAPDVCLTYSYPTVLTYANMGGVHDFTPLLESNKDLLPDMWSLLGDANIYWYKDPEKATMWAIESKLFHNKRINTFVREDWLKKLNIPEPKSVAEFEAMLKAFKSNASTLLGKDADKMIPFGLSVDVGWRANQLISSYIPNNFTDSDRDYYTLNFDDRGLLRPGIKNGIKKLNEWYNDGLIWKDFPLYPVSDTQTGDNLMRAGYVGAFTHNWDYPYRNGDDGISANLKKLVGPDAAYVAVECFENDAGVYKKFLSPPIDRKLFFPKTNDEPVASLIYLNWISKLENRKFLQIGEEGVTHEKKADGAVKMLASNGEKFMNSPYNIDYTITINGLDVGDTTLNIKSIASGYAGVEERLISKAYEITSKDAYVEKNYQVGEIRSEEGVGPALTEKRNTFLTQAIVAKPDKFDSIFDSGLKDYLSSGGQAIIDERGTAYDKYFK